MIWTWEKMAEHVWQLRSGKRCIGGVHRRSVNGTAYHPWAVVPTPDEVKAALSSASPETQVNGDEPTFLRSMEWVEDILFDRGVILSTDSIDRRPLGPIAPTFVEAKLIEKAVPKPGAPSLASHYAWKKRGWQYVLLEGEVPIAIAYETYTALATRQWAMTCLADGWTIAQSYPCRLTDLSKQLESYMIRLQFLDASRPVSRCEAFGESVT